MSTSRQLRPVFNEPLNAFSWLVASPGVRQATSSRQAVASSINETIKNLEQFFDDNGMEVEVEVLRREDQGSHLHNSKTFNSLAVLWWHFDESAFIAKESSISQAEFIFL